MGVATQVCHTGVGPGVCDTVKKYYREVALGVRTVMHGSKIAAGSWLLHGGFLSIFVCTPKRIGNTPSRYTCIHTDRIQVLWPASLRAFTN